MNRKDLQAFSLVGLPRENPVPAPEAMQYLDNQLYLIVPDCNYFWFHWNFLYCFLNFFMASSFILRYIKGGGEVKEGLNCASVCHLSCKKIPKPNTSTRTKGYFIQPWWPSGLVCVKFK